MKIIKIGIIILLANRSGTELIKEQEINFQPMGALASASFTFTESHS